MMRFVHTVYGIFSGGSTREEGVRRQDAPSGETTVKVRAVVPCTGAERHVSSLQVLVFDAEGRLDAYRTVAGLSAEVRCGRGWKDFWVVANAPDLSGVSTLDDFISRPIPFGDAGGRIPMAGACSRESSEGKEEGLVEVPLVKLVSTVSLDAVTNRTDRMLHIISVYLVNVAGDTDIAMTGGYEPRTWLNRMGFEEGGSIAGVTHVDVDRRVMPGEDLEVGCRLYCFPNDFAPAKGGPWSPRRSLMVVKAAFPDGTVCFYPVRLPVLNANRTYKLNRFRISGSGNVDNGRPPGEDDGDVKEEIIRTRVRWKGVGNVVVRP